MPGDTPDDIELVLGNDNAWTSILGFSLLGDTQIDRELTRTSYPPDPLVQKEEGL